MIQALKEGLDESNFSDGAVAMIRDILNFDKSLPKNFFYQLEIDRMTFSYLGCI